MEYNVVDISSSEKEVEIKLQYDEIKTEIEEEVKKQTKKIQLPGFRKGKAPLSMLKKMYGDAFEYEASEKIANTFFWKVAEENEFKPIGQPSMTDLKFEPQKELSFKVKYEVLPKIEVKNYKGLTFDVPDLIAGDDEINKEIDYILKSNKSLEDADVITDKNYTIDSEVVLIEKNGEAQVDSKSEKMQIDLTAEGIAKDIIENSKNKKVGDSFEFTFKDEHNHKLEDGKEEVHKEEYKYQVKINGIKKVVLPELNEELIKKVTKDKVTTEEQLKEEIKKDIQGYYDQQVEEMIRVKFVSEILKNNEFDPPKSLVNNILEEYVKAEEEKAKKSRYPFDKEESRNRLQKSAESEVKWYLLKNEIQKLENISITDSDFTELAEKESQKTGLPIEKLVNYYKTSNQNEKILDQKLFGFLKSNSTLNKVHPDQIKAKKEATNE